MENCMFCGNSMNFVRYEMSNKRIQIRKQCFSCGYLDTLNHKFSEFKNINELPFYSKNKRSKYKDKMISISETKKNIGRKDYYNKIYLKSDEWKRKRLIILKRDNFKCVCCNSEATQVHHINYNNVIKENFNDLISVCKDCHEKIHFEGSVFFKGLKANFGVLNFCQHCKQYHQDGISVLCNICKTKNHA